MEKRLFTALEAAKELTVRTGNEWTIGQVHREAAAGRLPVCFAFDGELILASVDKQWEPAGKTPRCLDFDGTVRSLTLPAKGQIAGFGCLVVASLMIV